jgi:hypothetical protein
MENVPVENAPRFLAPEIYESQLGTYYTSSYAKVSVHHFYSISSFSLINAAYLVIQGGAAEPPVPTVQGMVSDSVMENAPVISLFGNEALVNPRFIVPMFFAEPQQVGGTQNSSSYLRVSVYINF